MGMGHVALPKSTPYMGMDKRKPAVDFCIAAISTWQLWMSWIMLAHLCRLCVQVDILLQCVVL